MPPLPGWACITVDCGADARLTRCPGLYSHHRSRYRWCDGRARRMGSHCFHLLQLLGICLLFVRDASFAAPGRQTSPRVAGRADQGREDAAHLRPGNRALAQPVHSHFSTSLTPSVPYRDPLLRRYGDRWAGTRVLDSERKLAKARAKDRAANDQEEGSSACSGAWDDNGGACSDCLTMDARKLSTPCAGPRLKSAGFADEVHELRGDFLPRPGRQLGRDRRYSSASKITSSGIAANWSAGSGGSDSGGAGRSASSESVSTGS